MRAIALKMLFGDRAKYLGLVLGITFASFLMSQQVSIFVGLMSRTASQIIDVTEADIWVMDDQVQYIEEVEPLRQVDLYRVRSVPGVAWAAPLYKGLAVTRSPDGKMQQMILMGVDDDSLVGLCRDMVAGSADSIYQPDAMIMDRSGYEYTWPGEPVRLPRVIEMNDRRVVITGLCNARPPFVTFPIVYTRYSNAQRIQPPRRKFMSFVVVRAADGQNPAEVAERITAMTGLQALTWREFMWRSINYYLTRTGIPVNFGITVVLGFIIGAAVAGQTFFIFVLENLRQFGALKAIGVTNRQILSIVLMQALVVGAIGYGLGSGMAGTFFALTADVPALRGFFFPWQVLVGVGVSVFLIMIVASIASIRKVLVLDPAVVFR
jgi:putative ABC transport system permease protein